MDNSRTTLAFRKTFFKYTCRSLQAMEFIKVFYWTVGDLISVYQILIVNHTLLENH